MISCANSHNLNKKKGQKVPPKFGKFKMSLVFLTVSVIRVICLIIMTFKATLLPEFFVFY